MLARDTRWATMARAALRDDLFSLHADLTADVLRYESLDAWYEANKLAVDRTQEILGCILLVVAILGVGEFGIASLADGVETDRHLLLFHACTDITICFAAAGLLSIRSAFR